LDIVVVDDDNVRMAHDAETSLADEREQQERSNMMVMTKQRSRDEGAAMRFFGGREPS
jgi:hypothetical protein